MADKYWQGTTDAYGTAGNWSPSGVPTANDNVFITSAQSIAASDQSGVELDDFTVLPSMSGTIGTVVAPLQIDMADADRFEFAGSGLAFIDVGSAAISPVILGTASATDDDPYGLTLTGTAIATVDFRKGSLSVGDSTIATIYQSYTAAVESDTKLLVPAGASLTSLRKSGGTAVLETGATNVDNEAGNLTTRGSGAITTFTVDGGLVYPCSSGTITTLNCNGGTVDFTRSRVPRTVTTGNLNGGTLIYDPDIITFINALTGRGTVELV